MSELREQPDIPIDLSVHQDFFLTLSQLSSRGAPFAIATVIEVEGSGSAKPGSKALIPKARAHPTRFFTSC
jgi:XdhC and CoxI family